MIDNLFIERMKTEYKLGNKEFDFLRTLVFDYSGISLGDEKRQLIYGRLSKRLRALSLNNFSEYCCLLEKGDKEELRYFTNAMTTNLTSFFRENHHFDYLEKTILPALMRLKADTRKIRIWSAGCSTGEEPYSIAMTVNKVIPDNWDVRILATDIDSNVIQTAKNGIYNIDKITGIDRALLKKWFLKGSGTNAGNAQVNSALKSMVVFKQLNLMQDWPIRGMLDIIFCRNVVIYFDKPTQVKLFDRYANALNPEGYLFVGHSETLFKVTERFDLVGNTIYTKRESGNAI